MSDSDGNFVETLADEFAERLRRGETPSVSDYIDAYPECADDIRKLFPPIQMIEQLAIRREQHRVARKAGKRHYPDPKRLGEYRIVRRIGQGGMGVVYEAVHETLDRRVAVKMLPPHMAASDRYVARFVREAKAAARLHHTNIVPVFGVGEDDGTHFYVMQLIDGKGLDETGAADGHLESAHFRHVAEIGVKVARALEYAHQHGVLHRDVKPANILIDEAEDVWVTDFGLARVADAGNVTASGDVVGTLRYMPPESFQGKCDCRSDVYGLGATLFELLAGRPAFEDEHRSTLLRRIMDEEPPRLQSLVASVPSDLETIVCKAMEKEPDARYQTAGDLADDLQRFLDDCPIQARRITAWYRLRRWSRRNPALATLSATSALLLIAVTLLSTFGYLQLRWAYHRVDQALDEANVAKDEAEDERDRARLEYARAEANLSVAMRAFDKISDKLASRDLPQSVRYDMEDQAALRLTSGLSTADVEVVESLLAFYDEFAANNAAQGVVDSATAKVHRRIGDICSRLGQYERAATAYRQALHQLDRDADSNISSDEPLFRVRTWNALGTACLSLGDFNESQQAHEHALQWLQAHESSSSEADFRFELARTLSHLVGTKATAFAHRQSRRGPRRPRQDPEVVSPPAIQAEFDQAVTILKELVESNRLNDDYRLALARCHRSILPVAWASGNNDLAATSKSAAIEVLRELVSDAPETEQFVFELADTLAMTPYTDARTPASEADVAGLQESIGLSTDLHDQFPTAHNFTILLATTHQKIGSHFMATRSWGGAENHLRKAAIQFESLSDSSPQNPLYQVSLARTRWELAESLRRQDSSHAAREVLERAITDYRTFRETKVGQRSSLGLLVGLHRQLARTLEQLGEEELAAEASLRADQLRETGS